MRFFVNCSSINLERKMKCKCVKNRKKIKIHIKEKNKKITEVLKEKNVRTTRAKIRISKEKPRKERHCITVARNLQTFQSIRVNSRMTYKAIISDILIYPSRFLHYFSLQDGIYVYLYFVLFLYCFFLFLLFVPS